jgi:hypothetical protein
MPLDGDDMGVTVHRLSNGLTVYISSDRQKPRFTAWIVVRTGSRNDPPNSTGLAHYLEHMLFKGTDDYGTLDLDAEREHLERIEQLGGAVTHSTVSGVCDRSYENDVETLLMVRRFINYLPANNREKAPCRPTPDRADRVDQDAFRFEHGRDPRAQSQIANQRSHDGGSGDDDQPAEDDRLHPRPVQAPVRCERATQQRNQRAPGNEAPDRRLLALQSRNLEVEPALEQDHRDRELDDRDQTHAERARIDPIQSVGAETGAGQQQQHDPGNAQMPRHRLGEDADRQSEHQSQCGVVFHSPQG